MSSPAIQAITALQAQYPGAVVKIRFSASPDEVVTVPSPDGRADGPTINIDFVAESGATTESILDRTASHHPERFWPSRSQIDAVTKDTDLVMVSVGGNDVGFEEVIRQTLTPAVPRDATREIDAAGLGRPPARCRDLPEPPPGVVPPQRRGPEDPR
jgi:hypothetical protein